jgi:hypothetical protein
MAYARRQNPSYDKYLDVTLLWDVFRFLGTFVGLGLDSVGRMIISEGMIARSLI